MGNSFGKDDKKKGPQVNKANSYPQTKRGRRSTDGTPPHLNLETSSKEKSSKYGTGTFSKDTKLQQQLAEVRLGETIGKEKRNSVQERPSRKSAPQSENGRNESEPNKKDGSMRKRGSKLGFLHSSLKRGKSPSVPLNSSSTAPVAEVPKVPSSPSISSSFISPSPSSVSPSSVSPSPASISPSSMSPPSSPHGTQELGNSKPVSSLSEESDYMSSSVSSLEVGSKDSFFLARENSYQSYTTGFVDPDNVVGYSDPILKSAAYRPRGRSLSDSYKSNDSSRESSFTELQRAAENDMKKNRRFHELSKVLSERNNIIIDLLDLTFVRKIGEGAFSEVWEGYWNGVHVAIKRLKSMVNDELFQERFLREVESLRKGNHQNIVMCFGVCLNPACIITEYMAGGNLYDLLHKSGCRMSTGLVVKLALDLALGLLHLHSLGILHRDLTSLNVLLDDIGNIKISDFGLSREKSQEGSMTMTLGGICNPRWRPPEITKNIGHYSEKVDVYSFALVVWEILTGELPYANLDGPQAAAQVAYTNLRPIIPTSCPTPLRDLLQRCWADDAKLRPDFKEIVDELKSIQFHNPMALSSELR